ncbi:predicted protein [Nematostella vectensis]|uniref:Fibrinogen C-terminal domain-containing protein n=1 Tax=Nematostella vectensis TaxID=45351 RepID=A7SPD1_NEMVE|nr:predicted protein [Nematostella vectensis]|eukprot:XP_001626530.1 predicted protein [Nematostella vectensis]
MQVYCQIDQSTPRAWLVFQKRQDGSVDFYQNWTAYETGFGSLSSEFWLGLINIHRLTNQGQTTLRVEVEDWDGNMRYAEYSDFSLDSAGNISAKIGCMLSGTAGDSLDFHTGMWFSTPEQDNDLAPVNCAAEGGVRGGWWFNYCVKSNLNAFYYEGGTCPFTSGIVWSSWRGPSYSYKQVRMMISQH